MAKRKKYIILAIAIILCAAAWAAASLWDKTTRKFPYVQAAWVMIPAHASSQQILDSLQNALGYDYGKSVYEVWEIIKGQPEKAHGAYRIEPGDKSIDVARRIKGGVQTPVVLTFNNIRLFDELPPKISSYMEFSPEHFVTVCDSVLSVSGYSRNEYAAAFIPDSYEFYWTASPEKVAKRLLEYKDKFWTPERRKKAENLGLTPEQIIILASIVEEETARPDERGTIARLYMNRLAKGMKLQADPTVKFAVGDFSLRRILKQHLDTKSPYNTYIVDGLPPGPIRMPEKNTIDAVLNAPQNNYLYMCAKEDFSGRHNFATTLAEHNINATRYRTALDAKGIKK